MEEKRKLEKLLFADIETAITTFKQKRTTLRQTCAKTALEKAPAETRALLTAYVTLLKKSKEASQALAKLGYSVKSDWSNQYGHDLEIAYAKPPKALLDFDAETARVEKSLADLKRDYTLKLFAGGEQAQQLFASLTRELAAIVTN